MKKKTREIKHRGSTLKSQIRDMRSSSTARVCIVGPCAFVRASAGCCSEGMCSRAVRSVAAHAKFPEDCEELEDAGRCQQN
jgi:hypothetical protein